MAPLNTTVVLATSYANVAAVGDEVEVVGVRVTLEVPTPYVMPATTTGFARNTVLPGAVVAPKDLLNVPTVVIDAVEVPLVGVTVMFGTTPESAGTLVVTVV